jgi:hypothetical protein
MGGWGEVVSIRGWGRMGSAGRELAEATIRGRAGGGRGEKEGGAGGGVGWDTVQAVASRNSLLRLRGRAASPPPRPRA